MRFQTLWKLFQSAVHLFVKLCMFGGYTHFTMVLLKQIDQELSDQISRVRDAVESLQFSVAFEFELTDESLSEIPWEMVQYSGVYFIEIKNCNRHSSFDSWVNEFKTDWTNDKYKRKFVPNPKKYRIGKHSELTNWIPLYIGKSKNISKRFREHIFLELDQPTYALKLKSRDHLKTSRFRLSAIKIEVDNYDWIMPVLENAFRNKLNPIIGRQ